MNARPAVAPLLALLSLFAVACGGPEPVSGTWVFVNTDVTKQTCGDVIEIDISSGDFAIINNEDGSFTVDPDDGSDPFNCSLDGGGDFTCPMRLQGEYKVPSFDATLLIHVSAAGTFDSDTHAAGHQDAEITCTGSACAVAETYAKTSFPCQVAANFTASAK